MKSRNRDILNARSNGNFIVHLAAFLTVAFWGISFVSTKVLLDHGMGTVEIYIYRFVIAYLLVLAISHRRLFSHSWRDEGMFCLCGLCAGSIYFIAENTALQYTLTSNVSLLTSMSPLITALLVGFFFKSDKATPGMIIGSVVAFCGAACIIFNSSTKLEVNPLGDFLSIAAAFSWAIYSLILRRLNANYDTWFVTRKTFFYGVVTSLPFLFFAPSLNSPMALFADKDVVINILFLGLGASLIAYLMWSTAVKHLGPVKANNYLYLQPVITMIASLFILDEKITAVGILGCALILGGLILGDKLKFKK